MPTMQMNVRIDQNVKSVGDAAFKAAGYTPTEIIREVWSFAQRHRHDAGGIRKMVDSLRGLDGAEDAGSAERERLAAFGTWLEAGPRRVREACERHGVDIRSFDPITPESAERLLEEAYDEEIERIWDER